jgi:hypothetical protein
LQGTNPAKLYPPENSPFSLLKPPFSVKLEEEGKPRVFSPPPHSFGNSQPLFFLSYSLLERTSLLLEFSLDLPIDLSLDLSLLLKIQQVPWIAFLRLSLASERLLHRLNGRICVGLKTGFFQVRSAPLHEPKPDTRQSSISTDVPAFQRTPQRSRSTTTRRSVGYTLLRVDLTRWRVCLTRCPAFDEGPLCGSCCVFESTTVILCNFLWLYCLVISPICLVFRCFGVDLFFPFFLVSIWKFFFIVTSHLNLHGVFGRPFRCLNGVFELPMVVSITVCAATRVFLGLHSHLYFSLSDRTPMASENLRVWALASMFSFSSAL